MEPAVVLASDPDAARLGVELVDGGLELVVRGDHLNFLEVTHGGVVFSLAACALRLAAGPDRELIDTHLVLSGGSREGDRLRAEWEQLSQGRTLGSYRVTVTRGDGRLVASLTGTVRAWKEQGGGEASA